MNEDTDDIILEEGDPEVIELETEEETPAAPPAPAGPVQLTDAQRQELIAAARKEIEREARSKETPQGPPKPTLEDAGWDHEVYADMLTDWKLDQRDAAQRAEYGPVVQERATATHTEAFAREHNMDEVERSFIQSQFAMIPPPVLATMTPESKELFRLAAKAHKIEQAEKGEAKAQARRRVEDAEPVGGGGGLRYQLAEGVQRSEVDAYLAITGKTLNKETVKDLKEAGYLK